MFQFRIDPKILFGFCFGGEAAETKTKIKFGSVHNGFEENLMSDHANWNQAIIDEFRANAGQVGGRFAGKTLLLLHTLGAKSGTERVNPAAYVRDGDAFVVIASKGGAPDNPDWYYNLLAHPQVTIEVGTEMVPVRASVASEPERTRLYNKMVAMMPAFADYLQKTARTIPVIILTPEV